MTDLCLIIISKCPGVTIRRAVNLEVYQININTIILRMYIYIYIN